jgi:hypothetical protein
MVKIMVTEVGEIIALVVTNRDISGRMIQTEEEGNPIQT